MTLKEQQQAFDEVKWFDSVQAGEDKCGSYGFCAICHKWVSYPCARAARRLENGTIRVATVRSKK